MKYLLNEFNKLHIDLLLICCNTLSNIYLRNKIKTNYQIKTIFELNLANLHNNKILVTPSLKKFYINDNRFIACNLASSIENDNLTLSIQELKRLTFIKDKLILGCTHYPLKIYFINIYLVKLSLMKVILLLKFLLLRLEFSLEENMKLKS